MITDTYKNTNIKIVNEIPKNWKINNRANAPKGYVWVNNNKPRFSREYENALLKK